MPQVSVICDGSRSGLMVMADGKEVTNVLDLTLAPENDREVRDDVPYILTARFRIPATPDTGVPVEKVELPNICDYAK